MRRSPKYNSLRELPEGSMEIVMISQLISETETGSPEETEVLGAALGEKLHVGDYVALRGDLGAGKTAFTRGLIRHFLPNTSVKSPSYTLVNEYRGAECPIYHFDMYRIESEDDLLSIGYYDYLEDGICIVEWSEKIPYAIPSAHYCVSIEKCPENETKRRIRIVQVLPENVVDRVNSGCTNG